MRDPVKLPTSGVIVDRATIKMALLDKEEDPYNRKPLKEKDLIDLPDLK
jgi:ubiquitin conjugation factor E4 B